ncbi:uncharacterized protein CIMG_01590 [Coccidioides immitis RS]|uniref:Uncharacterized protein n=1 Tax=Coccidioides immitis (strain RS) TaxID=246410 RepID=J3KJI7_COCIM|nr:uncharacterized protein CIMG_01590 [Coccidioides immitis RS]EAS36236.3 hypothetical protein CIMG_01590 [Coccidioides immitis RS]
MAYNAISQNDHDAASNVSDSDASDSPPLPKASFEPLSLDFENLGGSTLMRTASTEKAPSISLKSVIRSRGASTTSYGMLEDDDYHAADQGPKSKRDCHVKEMQAERSADASRATPLKTAFSSPQSPELILQSPATDGPDLCHPTPDLQSLQGAYVGNVERLEKTAERLSLALDSGDNIANLEDEQGVRTLGSPIGSIRSRKQSVGSCTGPIDTRSGVYSPRRQSSSPRRSIQSPPSSQASARLRSGSVASRLAKVIEPENEDRHNVSEQEFSIPSTIPPTLNPPSIHLPQEPPQYHEPTMGAPVYDGQPIDRPGTAGSTDTYRQATNLFKDFDGVHFTAYSSEQSSSRRLSLSQPPLASLPQAHKEPTPGENMVYYPAPVPMVLNLPQRLSKKPATSEQEKRRTQLINSMPADKRKSAAWLPMGENQSDAPLRQNKRISQIPPQLRASAFFEQPPTHLDITVKENSAVATLDSILDAAALAPVSAFTDHPIVGHIGAGVYGKEKIKKRNKTEKHKPLSVIPLDVGEPTHSRNPSGQSAGQIEGNNGADESTPFRTSYDRERDGEGSDRYDDPQDPQSDGSESDDSEGKEEAFIGPPTTLLAELQMRKQEQKQRSRTAATAFPNGMHSTLLELDAVAQRQRENRNQRHVTLAWEDPGLAECREPDDDDVPLALLFPEKSRQADENRPLGLMEKLQLEENEPLSHRRARMRGEPPPVPRPRPTGTPQPPANRASTAFTLDIPGLEDNESDEEETLAQRVRRLKAREEKTASSDFASELLSKFGDEKPPEKPPSEDGEPEEETLAQRRNRLQAEAEAGNSNGHANKISSRRSMANILQAHPVGMQPPNEVYSSGSGAAASRQSLLAANRMSKISLKGPLLSFGNELDSGTTPYNSHGLIAPAYGNGLPAVNLNPHYYAQTTYRPGIRAEPATLIDQKQRDMIDRWRLGVQ